ncbi:MFS transporter [Streptomyces aidingensis]|nr:MFS transporter [Streptomyces aidingensis]
MTAPRLRSLRDFRLLYAGGLLAGLSAQLSALALPLLVLRATGSPAAAGTVGTVSGVAMLVSMLPAGAVADSAERRRLMMLTQGACAVLAGGLGAAVLLGAAPLVLILLVTAAGAVLTTLCGPAASGMLRAVVPRELLGAAASRFQARAAVARIAGPLLGGVLFGVHPALPFLAESAGLAVAVLCLAMLRTRSRPARGGARPLSRGELTAGIGFLWRSPFLRTTLLTFGFGMNAAFGGLMFAALALGSRGGASGLGAGTVVALSACGSLAGALIAPRVDVDGWSRLPLAATCWACAGLAGALALWQQTLFMGVAVGLCTALAAVASIKFLTLVLLATPDRLTGRVQSSASLVSSLATPLGPLTGGLLLGAAGPARAFAALGSVFLVCAAVMTWAPSVGSAPGPAPGPAPGAAPGAGSEAAPAPASDRE